MSLSYCLIPIAFLLTACEPEAPTADELNVFQDVLAKERDDSAILFDRARSGEINKRDSIEWLHFIQPAAATEKIPNSLLSAFWHVNAYAAKFSEPPVVPHVRILLTSHGQSREPSSNRYVLYLSRVAFAPGRDSTLVEYWRMCGSRCGTSTLMLLTRQGGKWVEAASFGGYIY